MILDDKNFLYPLSYVINHPISYVMPLNPRHISITKYLLHYDASVYILVTFHQINFPNLLKVRDHVFTIISLVPYCSLNNTQHKIVTQYFWLGHYFERNISLPRFHRIGSIRRQFTDKKISNGKIITANRTKTFLKVPLETSNTQK